MLKLQHASREKYLTVPTGSTTWGVRDLVDTTQAHIASASAGSSGPASTAAAVSKRLGWNSWRYGKGGTWHEAGHDMTVTCETPNRCI